MRWGEIILLWIAGLWTLLVSVVLIFGGLASEQVSCSYLVWLVLASLPAWIICGLVWVTAYGRNRRRVLSAPPNKNQSSIEESSASLIIPLHEIKDLAQHVVSDQGTTRVWPNADFLKTVCTLDEIQKFATNAATLQQIRAVVCRLLEKVKTADASTEHIAKTVINDFYKDMKSAEQAGVTGAVNFTFDKQVIRTYFVRVFSDIIEQSAFVRDGVKMLRPLAAHSGLLGKISEYGYSWRSVEWEIELLRNTIELKTQKKFLEHFEQMNRKAIHVRLSTVGYLPMSEATEGLSVAELLDRYQSRSLSKRVWKEFSDGLTVGVGFGFLALLGIGFVVAIGSLWMYLEYLLKTPRAQWALLPSVETLFARFPSLVDAPWKVSWIKWGFVIGLPMLIIGLFEDRGWHPINNLRDWLYPHQCKYCRQRVRKEVDSTNCCLSSEPTRKWKRQHRMTSNNELFSYGTLILLVAGALIYFLEWNYFITLGLAAWVVYGLWRAQHLPMATCTKCGVIADHYSEPSDVLCSRCYARAQTTA